MLILYDESTGRTVNRDICSVTDKNGIQAIYKENGIYVILGNVFAGDKITIECDIYQKKIITVLEDTNLPHYVWLMPNSKNKGSFTGTSLLISTEKNSRINVVIKESSLPYRLLKDIKKSEYEIEMYNLNYDVIVGRHFRISEGKKSEDIEIIAETDTNKYLLMNKIINGYAAEKTKIIPLICIEADNSGNAMAVLRDVPSNGGEYIIEAKNKTRQCKLENKQMLRVNMED